MILSDFEILSEVRTGRLLIEPSISDNDNRLQSASIDLGLSRVFWRPQDLDKPGIHVTVDVGEASAYDYFDRHEADEIELEPGAFVLGETKESIAIPRHLAGWIEGKSGRARHGLIVHCTAPHIAPGWGTTTRPRPITLELANLGKAKLSLRAGTPIAQLILMRLSSPSLTLYAGKHQALGS